MLKNINAIITLKDIEKLQIFFYWPSWKALPDMVLWHLHLCPVQLRYLSHSKNEAELSTEIFKIP